MSNKYVIAVDVGTLSARASLTDVSGNFLGTETHKLSIRRQGDLVYEQSTNDIWKAVCHSVRAVIAKALVKPEEIVGIGFDATCSLVLLDNNGKPLSASGIYSAPQLPAQDSSTSGTIVNQLVYDVIMWCDHRAVKQVDQITATRHDALRFLGERISVEANPAKLCWLLDAYGESFLRDQVDYIADLTDFLSFRATGSRARSLNTASTKFLYRASEGRFAAPFYSAIGLHCLVENDFQKLDAQNTQPAGSLIGRLTKQAAVELGLSEAVCVGAGLVDAYAGYVGSIAMSHKDEEQIDSCSRKLRIALICGTSICALSEYSSAKFVRGVWGPFERAIFDESDSWYLSGGQSSAGSMLDFLVRSHASFAEFEKRGGYSALVAHIESYNDSESKRHYDQLTRDLHVYPDFHGNRSPLADPSMCGMISGLTLTNDYDSLAKLYLAAIQSICYQTRHILEKLEQPFEVICASGGLSHNRVFVQQLANITGVDVLTPLDNKEPVLLGSAMVAATAAGVYSSLKDASVYMKARAELTKPILTTKELRIFAG